MGGGGRALTACYRLRMKVEQAARGNITRADQVTRLYVDLAWKPGDEFEPARKHALAAVGGN